MKSNPMIYEGGLDTTKPIYIGIDQSYSGFGLTFMNADGKYRTYVYKAEGRGVDRLAEIDSWLTDLYRDILGWGFPVDVAMEGYAFGSQMANMLGELGGLVKLFIHQEARVNALVVPPTMLKKFATGKGTGVQKNQILLNVYKKWDVEFKDDNAADSYILARIAAQKGTLAYEKEILEKLDDPKFRA